MSDHQIEIQLGHLCNNRCVFCSSGRLTSRGTARPVPLEEVLGATTDAYERGARRLTFLGGEPLLYKDLGAAVRHAASLGFEEIVIFTNGTLLARPGLLDDLCSAGSLEWRVSIQGGDEEAHAAATGREDSFRRLMEGLALLRERGQRMTANLCATGVNYRSLPLLPALLKEQGIYEAHVDMLRPSSAGDRSREELRVIMARYSDMAPYLADMLGRNERQPPPVDIGIGNLPFCVLPEWAHQIRHGGQATVTRASGEAALEGAVDKYAWHASMRRHLSSCESCSHREHCSGVMETYLEFFGEGEIRPLILPPELGDRGASHPAR